MAIWTTNMVLLPQFNSLRQSNTSTEVCRVLLYIYFISDPVWGGLVWEYEEYPGGDSLPSPTRHLAFLCSFIYPHSAPVPTSQASHHVEKCQAGHPPPLSLALQRWTPGVESCFLLHTSLLWISYVRSLKNPQMFKLYKVCLDRFILHF